RVARLAAAARAVDAWLFRPGDPRRLAALRIGLGAVLTIRLATGPYLDLAQQPAALFRPISFMKLLPAMPPPAFVLPVQVLAAAAAALATVGLCTRLTLPLAWLLAVPLIAMTSSLGKTVHNDVLLLLCLLPLLPSPAGAAWSLDAGRRRRRGGRRPDPSWRFGWPVWTAMAVVAGAYFFSGLAKLLHAGPGWVTSGNLRWVLYASSDSQPQPNPAALLVADRPWLAHLLAAGVIAVELAFPLALWRPRLARLLVPSVVALHAGIWVAMRLDYWPMAATVVIVMTDWSALARRSRADRLLRKGAPPDRRQPLAGHETGPETAVKPR
ncbi:MAG TPA: hypothetical protein VFA45_04545, partial [Actinomycetes bacterium]|nr:hypothetical protein [Actinomycetes bacterium]